MKRLVVISSYYPLGNEESYLENELRYLENEFDEIVIYTTAPNGEKSKYMPGNAKFIKVRENKIEPLILLKSVINLISIKTFKEIKFAFRHNHKNLKIITNKMMYYEYMFELLKNKFKVQNEFNREDTVYYSYWLAHGAYALSKLKEDNKIPLAVSRAHGYDAFYNRGYQPFRRQIFQNIDEVYYVSKNAVNYTKETLLPTIKGFKSNLLHSPLGVVNNEQRIKLYEGQAKKIVILSVSNIYHLKRLDLIIDALALIEDVQVEWLHIGNGKDREKMEQKALKVFQNKDNISYAFLGGMKNERVHRLYKNDFIDLFINLSDYEGVPVSIMEALSFGVPIIARNVGGINEVVIDSKNGFLLEKEENSPEVARAIEKFASYNIEKKNSMRTNAFKHWNDHYNAEKNYKNFSKHLKEIL